MNVNKKLLGLERATGYDVEEDVYTGNSEKYITFSYTDERPIMKANNKVLVDSANLNVNLYLPMNVNYMTDKHKVRDHLESEGFLVKAIQVWADDTGTGNKKIRHIAYDVEITEPRR